MNKQTKIYVEVLEEEAKKQFEDTMAQPSVIKGALMADAHTGYTMPIGGVVATDGTIFPAYVGYDIGCTDRDTEYLTKDGWKKIDTYDNNDEILVYDTESNNAYFDKPIRHIVRNNEYFYHIKTNYGIDQMLSPDHKVLMYKYNTKRLLKERISYDNYYTISARGLINKISENKMRDKFLTAFDYKSNTAIDFSDDEIRFIVALCADGSFDKTENVIKFNFSKKRKIDRLEHLLNKLGYEYTKTNRKSNYTCFYIKGFNLTKDKRLSQFKLASKKQMMIICDESLHWDGSISNNRKTYTSKYKEDCDYLQFYYASNGIRSTVSYDNRIGKESYRLIISSSSKFVGVASTKNMELKTHKSIDGKEYCFTTKTGYWVMRRNGNIVVTGNCGMCAVKLDIKEDGIDFKSVYDKIYETIPVGFEQYQEKQVVPNFPHTDIVTQGLNKKGYWQIGTLGGGNHFIEIGEGKDSHLWIVIHSGSRNLGHFVASYYMKMAYMQSIDSKDIGNEFESRNIKFKENEPEKFEKAKAKYVKTNLEKKLKKSNHEGHYFFGVDSQLGKNYILDMNYCLEYALQNRLAMVFKIKKILGCDKELIFINRNHNHAEFDGKYWIHRKGATHAEKDMLGVIPGNMRDGSFIVKGKGNPDSLCSSSHGAGRVLGRKQAKEKLSIDSFKEQMEGKFAKVGNETLDEAPGAYKDIYEVMELQKDLVEIIDHVKPIVNIKG